MAQQSIDLDPFASGTAHLESSAGSKVGGGRYLLVRILGRGGMGIVWLARDERLNCEVALKFLPPQIRYDASALDDLRRETARSHKLTHPNIVRVHDLYELPGEDAFISMEYVDGRNLADLRIDQASRVFSWQFLKPVAEQLCAALDYAHNERIVHRDLKPANLMLDNRGRLKLADFGIARAVSDTMSRISMSQTSGTLLYMSPQQLEGGAPDPMDDIYALGAILYELLTGKPPFYTGDIMHQVRNVAPHLMRERLDELNIANDVPRGVEQVIMSCLAKDVSDRPKTAAEVGRLLSGEKLKLVATVNSRTRSGAVAKTTRGAGNKKPWHWAVASGLGCGVLVWALAHYAQANARKREARTEPNTADLGVISLEASVSNDTSLAQGVRKNPATIVSQVFASAFASPASQPATPSAAIVASAGPEVPTREATPAPVPNPEPRGVKPAATELQPGSTASPAETLINTETPTNTVATSTSSTTALQLLQKGNAHVSARSQNRILQMASSRTRVEEPPQSWRILYYDEKTTYKAVEVRFEAGEMERVHEPNRFFDMFSPGASKTLDLAKVKIDSIEAIRIAVAECNKNEDVEAKWVELKLERGYGGLPVWNVKLFGLAPGRTADDASLGTVILLAEDGKVLKKDIVKKEEKVAPKK